MIRGGCSARCGFCGGCETFDEPDTREYPDPCDWCDRLINPGDALLANFGGRFCSDECATNYAESVKAGEMAPKGESCDQCGAELHFGWVSLAAVGVFCGTACANRGAASHEAQMNRRLIRAVS